jgi:hypothetical protein
MHQTPLTRRHLLTTLAGGIPFLSHHQLVAAIQTPETSPEPETLFSVTFPRDWQPEGEAQGAFYRITLEPGQSLTYLPGPYCGCSGETIQSGTAAERIMSGAYTVRLDRPFLVRRNGGEDEEIAAETEIALTEGDVAIYPDALAFGDLTNSGDETVVLFGASITSLEYLEGTFTPPLPEEMSARLSVAVWDAWQNLGDGDIDAALTRRTLAAGAELDPYEIVGLEAIHVQSGELHSSVIPPGASAPVADPRYISTGGTVAFREQTPGTRRLLANPFVEPAVLITLTFSRPAESNG